MTNTAKQERPFMRDKGGALRLSSSYNFVDKRESVDELRTLVDGSGLSYKQVHEQTGVALSTINNWFLGRTISPRSATMNAVGRLFGKRLGWVDDK